MLIFSQLDHWYSGFKGFKFWFLNGIRAVSGRRRMSYFFGDRESIEEKTSSDFVNY